MGARAGQFPRCLTPARSAKWPQFQGASCLSNESASGWSIGPSVGLREGVSLESPHSHGGERRPPCQPRASHLSLERSQTRPGTVTGPARRLSLRCHTLLGALRSSYLVVGVADGEVAHTDDDLVEQAFAGDLAALAQERAGNVPERERQALGTYDGLAETAAVSARPGAAPGLAEPPPGLRSAAQFLC